MNQNTNLPEKIMKDRKKITKTAKQRIINYLFWNCMFVIAMMLICLGLNIAFNKFSLTNFERIIKIAPMVLALLSIIVFELSYRKDSGIIALYAVEAALFSTAILFVPYMLIAQNKIMYLADVAKIIVIYYGAKSIVTFLTIRYKDLSENMSDVKELMAYNERKSYIDEESIKTLKAAKELKYLADEKKKREKQAKAENDNTKNETEKKQAKKPSKALDNKQTKKEEKPNKQDEKKETKNNQPKDNKPKEQNINNSNAKPKRKITGKK